jgi:preprotein translocase subunit YajC
MHLPLTLAQENMKPADTSVSPAPVSTDATSTTAVPTDGSQVVPRKTQGPFDGLMILLPIMLGVMIFMTFRSQSKEKKKRQQLLSTLSKGDRVQTIGGIIGNIVEIRDEEKVVIVKVDENNNTKMKFASSAIQNKIEE